MVQTKNITVDKDINRISDMLDKEINDFSEIRKEINILFTNLKE